MRVLVSPRWWLVLTALALTLAAPFGARVSLAQAAATISASPANVAPGDDFTVSGTGWDPNEQVIIESKIAGNTVSTDAQKAGPDGSFSTTTKFPESSPPGLTIQLVATGATSKKTATT